MNPNSSKHFSYFPAIQGHSGGTLVDSTLQDNVLLPNNVADYIFHIGNAHDMHSIIQGGLILGGRSPKRVERIFSAKYTNPEGYRESYSRRVCIMDVRIFLIPKRENQTKRDVQGKLVAVMLFTEFKVYLIQQFRNKTLTAGKSLKKIDSKVRESPEP